MTCADYCTSGLLLPDTRLTFPRWQRGGVGDLLDKFWGAFQGAFAAPFGGAAAAPANWWEAGGATGCIAAYQPKGAASLAASYTNLANPGTYDAAEGVAPAFDTATGWTFDGLNTVGHYLTTGITPASGMSVLIQFVSFGSNAGNLFGYVADGDGRYWFIDSLNVSPRSASGGLGSSGAAMSSGNLGIAGQQPYRDGAAQGAPLSSWTGSATIHDCFIGARVAAGGAVNSWGDGTIVAVAFYSVELTAPRMAAVAAAMAAL